MTTANGIPYEIEGDEATLRPVKEATKAELSVARKWLADRGAKIIKVEGENTYNRKAWKKGRQS